MPVAVNDSVATSKNKVVSIDVLANDKGLNNDPLTLKVVSKPIHGDASVQPGQDISYKPALDFWGQDSFTYKITDTDGDSAIATVSINVDCRHCEARDKVLTLSWNANSESVLGYIVFTGSTPKTTFEQLSVLPIGSGLIDEKAPSVKYLVGKDLHLKPGDQVCFRLKAYNGVGSSTLSETVCMDI
jgi:hypothetical protein